MQHLIDKFVRHFLNPSDISKETYSYSLLRPLLDDFGFLPISNSSLSFHTLATVCNDVVYNQRKHIVEFGSGISTLVIANLIRTFKLETKLTSIDHSGPWIDLLKDNLGRAGLKDQVVLIHAEKGATSHTLPGYQWYQLEPHMDKFVGKVFDSILVDGPEAHHHRIRLARYPALPFIAPFMNKEQCFICMDDSYRLGEREVLRKWSRDHNLNFHIKVGTSSCAILGPHLNPIA
jgi:hypothetical protein